MGGAAWQLCEFGSAYLRPSGPTGYGREAFAALQHDFRFGKITNLP